MHLLIKTALAAVILLISCSGGGPLTPSDSFKLIKTAAEKNDSEMIAASLSSQSLAKIAELKTLISGMDSRQLDILAENYGFPRERLLALKDSDAVYLYFFSDKTGIKLGRYFDESIVSIDIRGNRAAVKTESGVELDFLREGPYWKFDLSSL